MDPEKAESLIQHWEWQYKRGNAAEPPDSYTYCALIKAWGRSNIIDAELKALDILDFMEESRVVGLSKIAYNETMTAFARSSRQDASAYIERIYDRLLRAYELTRRKDFKPDRFTYFSVIKAYSKTCNSHHQALKSHEVMLKLIDSRHADANICTNAISAWVHSGSDEAIEYAEELVSEMDKAGIRMDGISYNTLMNVYAQSKFPDKRARAFEVFNRMERLRHVNVTSVTFSILMVACQDNEDMVARVFQACIRHGMLDNRLKDIFIEHGPSSVRDQLASDEIPTEWSVNANRGPGGMSRKQIRNIQKRGSTGRDVHSFGWAD
mmetsp:Transcript_32450/g.77530  ORF Transcript_32450/g.77530 Transcript_32450/m.77530 type:complete len:323 (-) Transcript_32450:63-1031(-)